MKDTIKAAFRGVGLEVHKAGEGPTMAAALQRFAATTSIGTVIDVGASDGRWSAEAMRAFPDADYLLFEANAEVHERGLAAFGARHPRASVVLAAAGDREGEVAFEAEGEFGGAVTPGGAGTTVAMTTVDAEVGRRDLSGPFLLKLDTHGFEVPILDGAAKTLEQAGLLVIETYNFTLMPGALRFHELCADLEERGFRPADVVDVMRRPGDGLLWQFDLFFLPADRPEFGSSAYR